MSTSFSGKALSFDVQVATVLGLHEAIIIHQIQYWINIYKMKESSDHFRDGRWWVYNTYDGWLEQFPFISRSTLQRSLKKLTEYGIIIHSSEYNKFKLDKTMWYSVDEERLADIISDSDSVKMNLSIESERTYASCKNEPTNNLNNTTYTTIPNNNFFNGTINGTKPSKEDLRTMSIDTSETLFDPSLLPFDNTNYHGLREKVMDLCVSIGQSRHGGDLARIIVYFYKKYADTFREKHPPVNDRTMLRCLQVLTDLDDPFVDQIADSGIFFDLIDIYFAKDYKDCDYHLPHFCSPGVLGILAYDQENDRFSDVKTELVC